LEHRSPTVQGHSWTVRLLRSEFSISQLITGAHPFSLSKQLQDIPKILKHKKDAIAFERLGGRVNYIPELPPSVYDRFSGDYRAKMNTLLKSLLKLDPQERMSFPDFFEFVDDLVTSKIEVMNLLTGTSGKILYDSGMT
jgi:hypothetical protein